MRVQINTPKRLFKLEIRFRKTSLLGVLLLFALTACAAKNQEKGSKLEIKFPSPEQLKALSSPKQVQSMTAIEYDFSRVCFAVDISGSGISPSSGTNRCEIPLSLFSGFVPPSGSISLQVPNGKNRKLNVIGYFRLNSSDPCPTDSQGLAGLSFNRLATIAEPVDFDSDIPEVKVTVKIRTPTQNLAAQYSLGNACHPPAMMPINNTASITAGVTIQSGGNFKAVARVSGSKNELSLTGGNLRAKLSRRE